MRTLTSNTLEIGSRTWAVETCMRSWKRRDIRSGILTSYERDLRWEEMLFGVNNRRYMDCCSVQRQREIKKFKTDTRDDRDRRKDINVVIGWVVNWENLVATSVVFFRHSSLGCTVHIKLVCARTIETGQIIREDTFILSTVARYISTASCFLATEMIPPLGFFMLFSDFLVCWQSLI